MMLDPNLKDLEKIIERLNLLAKIDPKIKKHFLHEIKEMELDFLILTQSETEDDGC